MAIDFHSPSFRAAQSDLTVAISPLGLVELADEEFEVHGPRLNRYAHNWAFYLGHHWKPGAIVARWVSRRSPSITRRRLRTSSITSRTDVA